MYTMKQLLVTFLLFSMMGVISGSLNANERELQPKLAEDEVQAQDLPFVRTDGGDDNRQIDQEELATLIDTADRTNSSSLVIMKDGELVGEWHRNGEASVIEAMSVTKVALSLVVGRLVTLDLLDIDTPVGTFFPDQAAWQASPKADITVRHLLTHTSGLAPGVPTQDLYASEDFLSFALNAPVEETPGSVVAYSNTASNLLAVVVEKAVDSSFEEFVADEFFHKLGIKSARWLSDQADNPQGMAGLQISAKDLAKLGVLALQRGKWKGERLISEDWFASSFTSQTSDKPRTGVIEKNPADIGFLWFLLDDGEKEHEKTIFHTGYLGQFLIIQPDSNLVAVRMIQQKEVRDAKTDSFIKFPEFVSKL